MNSLGGVTISLLLVGLLVMMTDGKTEDKKPKPKKDLRDYTDADLERLYEEWEVCV